MLILELKEACVKQCCISLMVVGSCLGLCPGLTWVIFFIGFFKIRISHRINVRPKKNKKTLFNIFHSFTYSLVCFTSLVIISSPVFKQDKLVKR